MITRLTTGYRKFRRLCSRTEWVRRLLGLPRPDDESQQTGLIMIQIDGLSRKQFESAMASGKLPTLKSFLAHDHYRIHSLYSGLPSSTPAVQGELFYGGRCAVPAFGFREHETHRSVRMLDQEAAKRVQARLDPHRSSQPDGSPPDEHLFRRNLLAGGSAYCDMYTGGSDEAHFCATSLGWSDLLQEIHPFKLAMVFGLYGWSVVRSIGLAVIELGLALASFLRRVITGKELWQELIMIPSRVMVVIGMREFVVIGVSLDAARGLPIIHANLLGYDEHAHRGGPQSRYAHWTLRGIDQAIRRIALSAQRFAGRHYDVWIYSDHGQEATMPYQYVSGTSIQAACRQALEDEHGRVTHSEENRAGIDPSRARWSSSGWLASKVFRINVNESFDPCDSVQVSACGPVALVYLNVPVNHQAKRRVAQTLVRFHQVPLACVVDEMGAVTAFTRRGEFTLPLDRAEVFGADHPFLQELATDWIRLCRHADAGDIVLSGWDRSDPPLTFAIENGAHAGPGSEETHAFALLPGDAPLRTTRHYLRPSDVRDAAMSWLGRVETPDFSDLPKPKTPELQVMTYNVHGCIGMDGMLSPARIARVIAQSDVDVVALQELDVGRSRSGFVDQAQEIARHLRMDHHFCASLSIVEERYGNAILSRVPMRLIETGLLPQAKPHREPRSVIWAEIQNGNEAIQVLCTHLSLYPGERLHQAKALCDIWVKDAKQIGDTILMGDFNALPNSAAYRAIDFSLSDAHDLAAGPTRSTWFSPRPLARIDHIFCTDGLRPLYAHIAQSTLARVASDHVPLVAGFAASRTHSETQMGHGHAGSAVRS